jgi:hypothetical protein
MKRIFLAVALVVCSFLFAAFAIAQGAPIDETGFGVWVKAHAPLVATVILLAGAVGHYVKKRARDETAAGFIEYFTNDHPAHSAGLGAAVLLAGWAFWSSDVLMGATATLVIASAWTIGWGLDSLVNKAAK